MTNETSFAVSGIILAGGKSRRMGRDKGFIQLDGKPIIARTIEHLRTICAELIIVANDVEAYAQFGEKIISDVYPGKGSLGGLYSGLLAARTQYAIAVACDMPFLNTELLRFLISLAPDYDIVIPQAQSLSQNKPRHSSAIAGNEASHPHSLFAKEVNLHPMHAVYSKNCLAPIHAKLMADELRLIGFYDGLRVRVVQADELERFDPKHLSLFNANTPEDLQIAQTLRGE